ncbi:phospholipase A2, partial [Nonomuraea sp. NPDC003201]
MTVTLAITHDNLGPRASTSPLTGSEPGSGPFDFRMPCRRHDFGYRNYKDVSQFPANKSRID